MKQAREKELEAWIDGDPVRQKKYGDVLPALRALQAESEKTREQTAAMMTLATASSYLGAAQTIYRLAVERPKADMDREAGFQERDWPRIRDGAGPDAAHDGCHRRPGTARVGRWALPPRCRPNSGSPRWTRLPA